MFWYFCATNKERVGECMKKGHAWALLPIIVFLVLFIGYGIWTGGFYNMPAIAGFVTALVVAFFMNRKVSFGEKLEVVARGMADENVMIMCLVFVMAGAFSGAVKAAGGADATVNFGLSVLPGSIAFRAPSTSIRIQPPIKIRPALTKRVVRIFFRITGLPCI